MKITDVTYLIPDNGSLKPQYIFLDYNSDTSINLSSNITENPIDAVRGATLQDKTVVDLISVGISGSFSNRNSGRNFIIPEAEVMFTKGIHRIENIIDWFEKALQNATIFTVCKKGVLYHNQLLNSLKWDFDDSASKIDVSLSFIEIEVVERAQDSGTASIIVTTEESSGSNKVTDKIKDSENKFEGM